jgi:hypothetical protein
MVRSTPRRDQSWFGRSLLSVMFASVPLGGTAMLRLTWDGAYRIDAMNWSDIAAAAVTLFFIMEFIESLSG